MQAIITRYRQIWALMLLILGASSGFAQTVCLVGAPVDTSGLPSAEKAAYHWALDNYGTDAGYISFADITANGVPSDCRVIWFHFEDDPALPTDAAAAATNIETFINMGGGILLSSFATEYALAINATTIAPNETINTDPKGPDAAFGIRPFPQFADHPVFAGIPPTTDWSDPSWSGFRTISDSISSREAIRWWTSNSFPGTGFGTMPWFGGMDLPVVGEIPSGQGNVMIASAPGYNWVSADSNGVNEQANLERFTANMLGYLVPSPEIILVGDPTDFNSLPAPEQNAYGWASMNFGFEAKYMSFSDIQTNGLPESARVIWFHDEDSTMISADAMAAAPAIGTFIDNGGGLFLTSFATQYALTIGATTTGPNEVINNNPRGPDAAWGIRPFPAFTDHPLFEGIPLNTDWADPAWSGFRTISDSIAGHEAMAWWTGNSFPGTGLAAMPWFAGEDLPVVGEINTGRGNVVIASAPGYQWLPADSNGVNEQTNLEMFTENALNYLRPLPTIAVIGGSDLVGDLPSGERNAYNYVLGEFSVNATYLSFANIQANGLPDNVKVVWYHQEDSANLPSSATAIAEIIDTFVNEGGGLLLSGFATGYAVDINATAVAPNETIDTDPKGPDAAFGIRPFPAFAAHPIFEGIPSTTDWSDPGWSGFRTISDSISSREAIRWWTAGSYPGTGYAAMPWFGGEDLPVIGEITYGDGGLLTATAPGYNWVSADSNGVNEQNNLERLTKNMIEYLFTVSEQQSLIISIAGGEIAEGEEDGKVIDVQVSNALFKDPLTPANWVVDSLPDGITASIARLDERNATITLSGTAIDYDVDKGLIVRIPSTEFLNLKVDTLSSEGDVIFKAFVEVEVNDGKIAVLGTATTLDATEPNARAAYNWAKRRFGDSTVTYFSFQDVILDSVNLLANYDAAWWHYEESPITNLPLLADNANVSRILTRFKDEGNGIFLSGMAPQFLVNLGLEDNTNGMEILFDEKASNPDRWGFKVKADQLNHPAFLNLDPVFFTLLTSGTRENPLCWFVINPNDTRYENIPVEDRFHGVNLASTEWDAQNNILVTIAEYPGAPGEGNVMMIGAGAFDWYIPDGVNDDSVQLQTLAFNILNHILVPSSVGIADDLPRLEVKTYPNPFSDKVRIQFTLDKAQQIQIEIFDVTGKKVANLVHEKMAAGTYTKTWLTTELNEGIYFYKIKGEYGYGRGKLLLQR